MPWKVSKSLHDVFERNAYNITTGSDPHLIGAATVRVRLLVKRRNSCFVYRREPQGGYEADFGCASTPLTWRPEPRLRGPHATDRVWLGY